MGNVLDSRVRVLEEDNYRAIFIDGMTYRFAIDSNKPISSKLTYPEFYDVAINSWCAGGCTYCYVAAKESGIHYANVVDKIKSIFGSMTPNQRPIQVALGGEGEPTAHPDFVEVLRTFRELGIVPNYTTNGMHLTEEIVNAAKTYSGGVAVSIHPHLKDHWESAIETYSAAGIKLNLHVVVSSAATIRFFWKLFDKYKDTVDYLVMLPYMSNREAPYQHVDVEFLSSTLNERNGSLQKVAFGSNLYEFLNRDNNKYRVSLYEPESMSAYMILSDEVGYYSDSHGMVPMPESTVYQRHIAT